MRHLFPLLILLVLTTGLCAYQNSYPGLTTPTELFSKEGEFSLAHRFYGDIDKDFVDTFLGMNAGANVGVGFRYNVGYNCEVKAGYTRAIKQYDIGASYRPTPADFPVQAQLDVQLFSFKQQGLEDRKVNLLYLASAQTPLYLGHLSFAVNAGFDGYYERLVTGCGMQVKLTDKLTLLGEYYPVLDRNSAADVVQQYIGKYDAYSVALKMDTYGHHFIFSVGNGSGMNTRIQSLGTDSGKLHLGFNIQRRLGV